MPHKCTPIFPLFSFSLNPPPSFLYVLPCYPLSQSVLSDSLATSGTLFRDPWLNSLICVNHVHHNVAFIQGHPLILQQLVEQCDNFHYLGM